MPGSTYPHFNSYREAKKTLKKIFSQTEVSHVCMTGGEPFLAANFIEIVLYCRMKGKKVTIISSGSAADRDSYSMMIDMGVTIFEFPVHSAEPEVHDRLTRTPGSWDKAVNSIRNIISLGGTAISVTVLTAENYSMVGDTIRFIEDLGVTRLMLNRYNIGGEGIKENAGLELTHVQLKEAFRIANSAVQNKVLHISSNVCTPVCVINPKEYPRITFSHCSVDLRRMPVTLDAAGNIRICNHSPVVVGNIHHESLEDIFRKDYLQKWKEVPEYCSGCGLFEKCRGGCRAASEQTGGSPFDVDPILRMQY
jgi:radical SAM protein with 4Fe4S-binding SPASM domain